MQKAFKNVQVLFFTEIAECAQMNSHVASILQELVFFLSLVCISDLNAGH